MKDHSRCWRSSLLSHIDLNCRRNGRCFIPSMRLCLRCIKKTMFMDQISLILHQILLKDKKNGKLNGSLDTRSNADVKEHGKLNTRKGYEDMTWEPEENLENAQDIIANYWTRQKKAENPNSSYVIGLESSGIKRD